MSARAGAALTALLAHEPRHGASGAPVKFMAPERREADRSAVAAVSGRRSSTCGSTYPPVAQHADSGVARRDEVDSSKTRAVDGARCHPPWVTEWAPRRAGPADRSGGRLDAASAACPRSNPPSGSARRDLVRSPMRRSGPECGGVGRALLDRRVPARPAGWPPAGAGHPGEGAAEVEQVAREFGAEEVIVVSITSDHGGRRRSYELIAEEFG